MNRALFAVTAVLLIAALSVSPAGCSMQSSVTISMNELIFGPAGDVDIPTEDGSGNPINENIEILPSPDNPNEAVISNTQNSGFVNEGGAGLSEVDVHMNVPEGKRFCLFFQLDPEERTLHPAKYNVTIELYDVMNPKPDDQPYQVIEGRVSFNKEGSYFGSEVKSGIGRDNFVGYPTAEGVTFMESLGTVKVNINKELSSRNVIVKIIYA